MKYYVTINYDVTILHYYVIGHFDVTIGWCDDTIIGHCGVILGYGDVTTRPCDDKI